MTLAGYIGVRGTPQNEGAKTIAMTAPVAMKQSDEVSEVLKLLVLTYLGQNITCHGCYFSLNENVYKKFHVL